MNGARTFGKNNLIDPAINVIEMISISRHWDIPNSVIETAALWEYKKSANKLRNEAMAFKHVLTRLHGFFQSKVGPTHGRKDQTNDNLTTSPIKCGLMNMYVCKCIAVNYLPLVIPKDQNESFVRMRYINDHDYILDFRVVTTIC